MHVRLKIPNIMRQGGRCLEGPDQSGMSLHRGATEGSHHAKAILLPNPKMMGPYPHTILI